jgi:hypothetical protein
MPRMRIPELGVVTQELSPQQMDRLVDLAAKLDRPPIDLSNPPAQREVHTGYAIRSGYADIDAVIQATVPQGYAELSNFSRTWDQVNTLELARITQDAASLPRLAEDRMSHLMNRVSQRTYVPAGYAAYSFAAQGGVTGMATCGPAPDGYCMNRTHEIGCGSSGDPAATEALRPAMKQIAQRPYADANGRIWADAESGAPMSLLDHAEASLGIRLGDKSLFESGRSKREVVQARRTPVYGDPDTGSGQPFAASTMRTAQALADASKGYLSTSADVARQRDAWKQQHQRLQARIGTPRHQDYAVGLSNSSAPRDTRLVPFEGSTLGSLVPYASAGTVSGQDEVFV